MNKLAFILRESGLARFLIPFGIILAIFGGVMFSINKKNQNYVETEATITKVELDEADHKDADGDTVEATYYLSIKYTVNGKEYEAVLDGMPKQEVGETTKIYYNPSDPSQITGTKTLIIPLIMMGAGAAALVGGVVSLINAIKRYKKLKDQEKEWANG